MDDRDRKKRAFYRIAWNVFHMWKETKTSDTRLFQEPLISDKHVTIGQSESLGNYREHAIPRLVLCEKCHEMYAAGSTVQDVADFIEEFLIIVLISREEQQLLDRKDELNLKQKMPANWDFKSGDPLARLRKASIQIIFNKTT
ncbi:MAG: hypothetical protein ACJAU9_000798 [Lentimonas sp.]|jgi:hypothetical protein